jgi:hypothetical protein
MKTRIFLIAGSLLLLCMAVGRADDETELHQTADSINHQSTTHEGERRVLHSIAHETGVPAATLRDEKRATGYGNGELLIANLLARASGKSFDEIVAMRKTEGWGKLAHDLGLNLGHIVSRAHRADEASRHERRERREGRLEDDNDRFEGDRGSGRGNNPGRGMGRGHRP